MFHSSHIHIPNRHRQRTALRTFFPSSSFSPPDSKEPLRRGIVYSSVASVLLLVGCILTWLEFNDVFGGKISVTGPVLIVVALLMMLMSFRQFRLARIRNRANNGPMQLEAINAGGVTALVVDQDEGVGPTTVVVDAWEGDRPEIGGIRVNEDLAPPSYIDVAQLSCSSNCPSFVSHEDRNEAPPTYEETCGMFSFESESSLAQSSRRCSSQLETSICPGSVIQGDPNSNNRIVHSNASTSQNQVPATSHRLSPGSALLISAWQRNIQKGGKSDVINNSMNETSSNASISSDETVATVEMCPASKPGNTNSQIGKRAEWGKRSFSSIPSYTCLLSESGEVSAQVYNTSSIISQMLPNESVSSGATFDSFFGASTSGPTRSHSTSSINNLRQGVPYNIMSSSIHIPANTQASITGDSPATRRCSEGSRPNEGVAQGIDNAPRQRSDSNIATESSTASLPLASQASCQRGSHATSSSNPDCVTHDKADTSGNSGSQVPAVRGRSSGGHEVLILNTQDVQETI